MPNAEGERPGSAYASDKAAAAALYSESPALQRLSKTSTHRAGNLDYRDYNSKHWRASHAEEGESEVYCRTQPTPTSCTTAKTTVLNLGMPYETICKAQAPMSAQVHFRKQVTPCRTPLCRPSEKPDNKPLTITECLHTPLLEENGL